MKNLLNDFFVSSAEIHAIDYFFESMAKTHVFDEKFVSLRNQNAEYRAEIEELKQKIQTKANFYSEKSIVNSSDLIKLDLDIIEDEISRGMWTDTQTGLMWARFSIGQEWKDERGNGRAEALEWEQADQACHEFRLGNYCDWRLPEINDLETLLCPPMPECERSKQILTKVIKNLRGTYWSNTMNEIYNRFVHAISFGTKSTSSHLYSKKAYVRPVRSIR